MFVSAAILKKIAPQGKKSILDDLEKYMTDALNKYQINTPLRVAHFLAQAAQESDGFKTLKEYWGPTAAQKRYEGRQDLGNTVAGDGKRFMGRGIFQLTGRYNYAEMSKKLGVDLVENPDLAATGKLAVLIACEYWISRKISPLADKDDIKGVTKKINGGHNGLDDRIIYLGRVKKVIDEIMNGTPPSGSVTPEPVPTPTPEPKEPSLVIHNVGDTGVSIRVLQAALNHKGYDVSIDGIFGPKTATAIKEFQKSKGLPVTGIVDVDTFNAIVKV